MKNIIVIMLIAMAWVSCSKRPDLPYSDCPKEDMVYKLSDGTYTNFEHYMFDEGFPDSIIIELKRDSSVIYMKIPRYTVLKDSLGNYYSPGYAVFGNDCIVIYDIKGRRVELDDE